MSEVTCYSGFLTVECVHKHKKWAGHEERRVLRLREHRRLLSNALKVISTQRRATSVLYSRSHLRYVAYFNYNHGNKSFHFTQRNDCRVSWVKCGKQATHYSITATSRFDRKEPESSVKTQAETWSQEFWSPEAQIIASNLKHERRKWQCIYLNAESVV